MKERKLRCLLALLCTLALTLTGCNRNRGDSSQDSSLDSTNIQDSTSSDDGGDGGDGGLSDGVESVADQSEVSDFNIYFYSTDLAPEDQSWVWAWNDDKESFAFPAYTEQRTIEGIGDEEDNVLFTQVHLTFGQAYQAWSKWDVSDTFETTMQVPDAAFFDYIIFRSADGKRQSKDISIQTSLIQQDEEGHYSIFIDGDKGQTYYSTNDFPVSPVKTADYGEANLVTGKVVGWIDLGGSKMEQVFAPGFNESTISVRAYDLDTNQGTKIYRPYSDPDVDYSRCEVISDTSARIYFESDIDITNSFEVWVRDPKSGNAAYACDIGWSRYFNSEAFDAKYYTDVTLGATVSDDGKTTFRLWAPTASAVGLYFYADATSPSYENTFMNKGKNGVWERTVNQNLHGIYYTFGITLSGATKYGIPDPYALSSSANGERSMVVDFKQVKKPAGYEKYDGWTPDYDNFSGVTIMEMHTRDVTSDPSWNGSDANRGKFNGLVETGTTLPDGTPTGFDYIKELGKAGLTHVQIMPAFDFSSVDETKLDDPEYQDMPVDGTFNWGYDPQQYNVPEGSYSSDPDDGYTRVEEFMNFVNQYNAAGIGVVMDVVYNHMPGQAGSSFEQIVPGYYFRDVTVSGAGVDLASQRSMVRQYIVDSVTMWAKEYHVSGFRFDLMGILDLKTMQAVRKALDEINPKILVYGEGWQMFYDGTDPSTGLGADDMAYQRTLDYMGEDWVGSFNDDVRDAIKGSQSGDPLWTPLDRGYAQNAILGIDPKNIGTMNYQKGKIMYGLTGTLGYDIGDRPKYNTSAHDGIGASVCYTECHDNLMLWDKLKMSTPKGNRKLLEDMAKMANATVLSALSSSFFQIGQDFGRSKEFTDTKFLANTNYFEDPYSRGHYFSHNSYNLSDEVNGIDWTLLDKHASMEKDFRRMLNRRVSASKAINDYLGREISYGDFSSGFYSGNVEGDNPYVIAYKLNMGDQSLLAVMNYSTSPFVYDGQTVPARSADILVY